MNKTDIDLSNFLAEAKKQTYANKNIKKSPSSRLGSFDYEYSNGKLTYHDTYFGGTKFIGEEVVYNSENSPVWGMNYYGVTLNEDLTEDMLDNALRPALMKVEKMTLSPYEVRKNLLTTNTATPSRLTEI